MQTHSFLGSSLDFLQMGTWKAGQSIIYTGIRHPTSVMKNVIPIVMAGGMSFLLFREAYDANMNGSISYY
jgi:hypothetical protein